jgi:hypothetical protein
MKIRSDFVTNSSSSSFIIAVKEELTPEKLYKVFDVHENHPFVNFVNIIFRSSEKTTEEKIVRNYDYLLTESQRQDILGKGYLFYKGYFSDEGASAAEAYLCNTNLDISEKDFIMLHEGGY